VPAGLVPLVGEFVPLLAGLDHVLAGLVGTRAEFDHVRGELIMAHPGLGRISLGGDEISSREDVGVPACPCTPGQVCLLRCNCPTRAAAGCAGTLHPGERLRPFDPRYDAIS
jgi:hypothetical protein